MNYRSFGFHFIALLVIICAFSCQSGNQQRVLLIHDVDADKLTEEMDDYRVDTQNPTVIDLTGFDLSNKQISDADLFIDTMWYVPLETSDKCIIGETQKIELDRQSVFILDKYSAKGLFRFALSGNFLNQIGSKGNGPGEFAGITDFLLVEDKVAVYDQHKRKIHYYTKDGAFLYDKSLPFICSQFEYLPCGQYLFYTFSEFNHHVPNIRNYNVLLCDSSFNIVKRGMYVDKDNTLRMNSNTIKKINGQIYYNQYCNDTVYLINDTQIQRKYFVQLKNPIPSSLYKKGNEGRSFLRSIKEYNCFSSIDAVTNDHLMFRIKGQDNIQYTFVYSKHSGKTCYGVAFKGDRQLNPSYIKTLTASNDTIIGLYQTEQIRQTSQNNPNLSPFLKGLVEKTSETDNPILTFFKLKKF
ncbi:MAG: 6-bladed beta-propeller [Bacteroidales bacterium]|jgi:hypothetical protein|nr:6-bladed beta-propeller [Bacteroidales bacterium]